MVRVAGSNPVFRSGRRVAEGFAGGYIGGMAEWLGKGLQNPVPRFDSGCRLSGAENRPRQLRAISSGGERFLDAEEVSGSNPLSPTRRAFGPVAISYQASALSFLPGLGRIHPPFPGSISSAEPLCKVSGYEPHS